MNGVTCLAHSSWTITQIRQQLNKLPHFSLTQLPTPIHRLSNFGKHIDCAELWIKRDDLSGLAGGGNKTRKLEFLVGDALKSGADTLLTVGAIQSNHTRQTAAAAARAGLKCALLHCDWTRSAGPTYRQTGNILLSSMMGAELFFDEIERPIEDQGPLEGLAKYLTRRGQKPYVIPGGASDHPLGSYGYVNCAAEIAGQEHALGITFDLVVHTTGSSSTQSGLLAGFAAIGSTIRVIGVPDDEETEIKRERIHRLANVALKDIGSQASVPLNHVDLFVGDRSPYGMADAETIAAIKLFARSEGLIADPVYEGKALRGLIELSKAGQLAGKKVLLLHLGGTPAVHGYAAQLGPIELKNMPGPL
jgi:1-aminocyclopropane-1-carboxylate deaminase